jgi:hypothetical protein
VTNITHFFGLGQDFSVIWFGLSPNLSAMLGRACGLCPLPVRLWENRERAR